MYLFFDELAITQRWSEFFCATGAWGLIESFLRISNGLKNLLLPEFKLFFGKKPFSEEAFEYWKYAQRKSSSKMRKTRRIWWSRGFILYFPSIRNESFFLQVPKTTRFLEKDFFFFLLEKHSLLKKRRGSRNDPRWTWETLFSQLITNWSTLIRPTIMGQVHKLRNFIMKNSADSSLFKI